MPNCNKVEPQILKSFLTVVGNFVCLFNFLPVTLNYNITYTWTLLQTSICDRKYSILWHWITTRGKWGSIFTGLEHLPFNEVNETLIWLNMIVIQKKGFPNRIIWHCSGPCVSNPNVSNKTKDYWITRQYYFKLLHNSMFFHSMCYLQYW